MLILVCSNSLAYCSSYCTGNFYVVDGPSSRLIVLGNDGAVKGIHALGAGFEQPEGISFSPAGEMYISNEGVKSSGNITHVQLN